MGAAGASKALRGARQYGCRLMAIPLDAGPGFVLLVMAEIKKNKMAPQVPRRRSEVLVSTGTATAIGLAQLWCPTRAIALTLNSSQLEQIARLCLTFLKKWC